jgi:glutamate/tyrosine decarboxylase-like PLP-dependent enzyme
MTAQRKSLFEGLSLADSISIDPHKWLYVSIDCGCLLFRDAATARKAFLTEADYIRVNEPSDIESFAFWDYGIELTRRFRALKVWLTLKYYGLERIIAAIADDIAMAEYMAQRIGEAEDFDLLAPTSLSICCFRYVPKRMRAQLEISVSEDEGDKLNAKINSLNEIILQRVQRGGEAYISNVMLRGQFALRACIINFRTTRADVDFTLQIIRNVGQLVEAEQEGA